MRNKIVYVEQKYNRNVDFGIKMQTWKEANKIHLILTEKSEKRNK